MRGFSRSKKAYVRFVEKQGFPIIVTVCVAIITATALWTGQQQEAWAAPTPPVSEDVSAAQLMQQSLRQATAATPAPTTKEPRWYCPVENGEVITPFSADKMIQRDITGIWEIHDAVDLRTDRGSLVRAMAEGVVIAHGEDALQGVWAQIKHTEDIIALYAGMSLGGAFITGDAVLAGDVIGYSGNGILDEANLPPHLHLRVTRHGIAVDPSELWSE